MICTLRQTMHDVGKKLGIRLPFSPYQSEAEIRLGRCLDNWAPTVKWFRQVKVETRGARFWLDLAGLIRPGRAVAFECDGRAAHVDWLKDLVRDAVILETGRIARIYRFSDWDCYHRPVELLALLGSCEPKAFRPRYQVGLDQQRRLWKVACRQLDSPSVRCVLTKDTAPLSYWDLLTRLRREKGL